jgi:hypothetical protein
MQSMMPFLQTLVMWAVLASPAFMNRVEAIHNVPFQTVGNVASTKGQEKSKCSSKEREDSQRSCGFIEPASSCMALLHEDMQAELASKQRVVTFREGGTIYVYFHIIQKEGGKGHVTATQIENQMDILNAAFAGGGWNFVLVNVEYVANNDWFRNMETHDVETKVKRKIRVGTGEDLNIYTAGLSFYLGWAYLPNYYNERNGFYDGVVVDYTTLPGGSQIRFNEGDTGNNL